VDRHHLVPVPAVRFEVGVCHFASIRSAATVGQARDGRPVDSRCEDAIEASRRRRHHGASARPRRQSAHVHRRAMGRGVERCDLHRAQSATEEPVGTAPDATVDDMRRAIAAARRAFDEGPWPGRRARSGRAC